ncbi:MAG: HdeD family acid-resistance protein [Campylobacterota bacterium]|nr:HdeD family acid-resistance protein [Campylobacterota bacterium]
MITVEQEYMKAMKEASEKRRKSFMALGILSLVLGIVGLFMSVAVTLVSTVVFGIFMVMVGVLFFIEGFSQEGLGSKILMIFVGTVYIMGGAVMTIHPTSSAVWITLFMAIFFIVIGVVKIISAFMVRKESPAWIAILINGLLGLILGVMVYSSWPGSGLWVIGMFVSIELIMQGIVVLFIASAAKRLKETIKESIEA